MTKKRFFRSKNDFLIKIFCFCKKLLFGAVFWPRFETHFWPHFWVIFGPKMGPKIVRFWAPQPAPPGWGPKMGGHFSKLWGKSRRCQSPWGTAMKIGSLFGQNVENRKNVMFSRIKNGKKWKKGYIPPKFTFFARKSLFLTHFWTIFGVIFDPKNGSRFLIDFWSKKWPFFGSLFLSIFDDFWTKNGQKSSFRSKNRFFFCFLKIFLKIFMFLIKFLFFAKFFVFTTFLLIFKIFLIFVLKLKNF